MIDRRLIQNFDWILLCLVLTLAGLGILNLYSASSGSQAGGGPVYLKQAYWLALGLVVALAILFFDYHQAEKTAYMLYALGLLLLILVLISGQTVSGSQRWLELGFFRFQPSELVKIIVLVTLARYFSRREYPEGLGLKDLIMPMLLAGIPFLLILAQPDLGTALHLAIVCLSLILFLKVRWDALLLLSSGVAAAMPFIWSVLKAYQKQRIITFLNPAKDPHGAGYHIIQSKIAVGSGQAWGKGFMKGTQSHLRFLPEQQTDFAFSVFAEEWGFVGALVLLGLFFLLLVWALRIANRSQDRFGALLGVGLVLLIFWQFFINICMVIGLMPVVGIPLPFISYGGSSLVTLFIGVGLLLNISMRRFMFQK
ncbi:MAG: rod shape-determining protein RodA [Deltaproteobacteria bacterium]|nr:rod shape-determining protein RodA [Deltaproteobacteria bacterium]MBW2052013.1 rod shape-determining protein RodA [Deltaproteobacteria bacterium]MBW2139957.1 rod shape-determining protein RodA [Deltaproteobacteria bacterium]MBW2322190.1 rod shape-determining protein RodA [Deltaproteobacteria bacterium]